MFELLLQADKALAKGKLDQAEKTYSQLIELDPTNAIALAGLARVAQTRGDEPAARSLVDRALGIDPASVAALRVLDELDHGATAPTEPEATDLPLVGAARLEALSRRRATEAQAEPEPEATEAGARAGARKAKARPEETPVPAEKKAGRGTVAGVKAGAAGPAGESRGRTRPDEIKPLPAEPLHDRRQAGRLAAAAAAAAAASREPVRPRHHHAMPVGRRFGSEEPHKPQPLDEFAAAEMAAAVAAVDALDDSFSGFTARPPRAEVARERRAVQAPGVGAAQRPAAQAPRAEGAGERPASGLADVLGAVDATEADASVAMRLALLGGATGPEEAERAPSERVHDTGRGEPEAAEARRTGFASIEAAESVAVEAPESVAPETLDFADADAAEAAAAAEAVHEVAGAAAELEPEPAPEHKHFEQGPAEPSEEEAEAQALREAMAMVLQGEGSAGAPASTSGETAPSGEAPGQSSTGTKPVAGAARRAEIQVRKAGLFRRIRGG
jgi:tetratricopeptide (TPR) repeat protein